LNDSSNVNRRVPELEGKIAMLSQEIERLNSILDKKNGEIKALREGEVEAEGMAQQLRQLTEQIKRLTGENEGLYGEVRQGQEQLRLSSNQINKLKTEVDEYKFSVEDLKRRAQDVSTSKISEYENKIAMFSQ
jgi:chromosome segregation ATPase